MSDSMICWVTGGSGDVGAGIAHGLGELGATVYLSARTVEPGAGPVPWRDSLQQTAELVERAGGTPILMPCDHRDDHAVRAVAERIRTDHGHLDVLANAVWGGYDRWRGELPMHAPSGDANDVGPYNWEDPFWRQPLVEWDDMFITGVRTGYAASALAAPLLIDAGSGLIINVSAGGGDHLVYAAAHAAIDDLTQRMSGQLRPRGVAVVSLKPGLVIPDAEPDANAESPLFVGRAAAALATDAAKLERSGGLFRTHRLALDYGFTDVDGRTGSVWEGEEP